MYYGTQEFWYIAFISRKEGAGYWGLLSTFHISRNLAGTKPLQPDTLNI